MSGSPAAANAAWKKLASDGPRVAQLAKKQTKSMKQLRRESDKLQRVAKDAKHTIGRKGLHLFGLSFGPFTAIMLIIALLEAMGESEKR